MGADVFLPHFCLRRLHLDATALLLKIGELLAGGAEGRFDGLGAFVDFRALRENGAQAGFFGFQFAAPFADGDFEGCILGGERVDTAFVVGNIETACIEEFVQFDDACGHWTALAVEALLLLALGGNADADFVEGIGGGTFLLPHDLNAGLGFAAGGAEGVDRAGRLGDADFEFAELGEAAAQSLLDARRFALERGPFGFDVRELALGMAALIVGRGRFNLRDLHRLASLLEAVCGLIHRRRCGSAGGSKGFDASCGLGQ